MSALVCGRPPCRLEDLIALPDELGKPNPDRLRLYRAYLHYQLQRGIIVGREKSRTVDDTSTNITEAGYNVLRILSRVTDMGPRHIIEITGHGSGTLYDQGRRLKRMGWIEAAAPGKHSRWKITGAGRRALAEHDGAAAD